MKEQLVSLLVSKVGLDQGKAEQAVDTVMQYLKDNPDQLKGMLGGVAGKLGGMF